MLTTITETTKIKTGIHFLMSILCALSFEVVLKRAR